MPKRSFTTDELKQFDGKHGNKVYVAYRGQVYGLSSSYFWRGGVHWVEHTAGHDLTDELAEAPHGPENLDKFPVVGKLDTEQ